MNNKRIAEFMGMEFGDDGTMCYDDAENRHPPTPTDMLAFHTSWDWLMPVVEKINDLTDDWGNTNDFTIGNGFVWVDPHIGDRIFFSGNNPEDKKEPMISKVYRGAVKFIEQYTTTQNQDESE